MQGHYDQKGDTKTACAKAIAVAQHYVKEYVVASWYVAHFVTCIISLKDQVTKFEGFLLN